MSRSPADVGYALLSWPVGLLWRLTVRDSPFRARAFDGSVISALRWADPRYVPGPDHEERRPRS